MKLYSESSVINSIHSENEKQRISVQTMFLFYFASSPYNHLGIHKGVGLVTREPNLIFVSTSGNDKLDYIGPNIILKTTRRSQKNRKIKT